MLHGFQKVKPSSDASLPITPNILKSLLQELEHTTSSFFTKVLGRAMFMVAFCAFLRVGDINKTSGTTQHYILFGNVVLKSDAHSQYIELSIPHSNIRNLPLLQYGFTKIKLIPTFVHTRLLSNTSTLESMVHSPSPYSHSWMAPLCQDNILPNNFAWPYFFELVLPPLQLLEGFLNFKFRT